MIKLMIVDDESSIRRGLKHYIDWNAWGISLEAEAPDGEEAFRRALEVRPDILISDIRMPEKDGLELCSLLRDALPGLRIILLTGYDRTDYLHAALQNGVHDYLLKPASADKIISSVLKCKEEIVEEQNRKAQKLTRDALLDESIPILQMMLISDLLKGNMEQNKRLVHQSKMLGVPLDGPVFQTMTLHVSKQNGDECGSQVEQDMIYWQLIQKIESICGGDREFFCELAPEEYFILINADSPDKAEQRTSDMAERLVVEIGHNDGRHVVIGIGTAGTGLMAIGESYRTAKEAFRASAWNRKKQIFYSDEGAGGKLSAEAQLTLKHALSALATGRDCTGDVSRLFGICRREQTDIGELRRCLSQLIAFYRGMTASDQGEGLGDFEEYQLDDFLYAEDLEKWVRDYLGASRKGENRWGVHSQLIAKTIAYLKVHYREEITLQTLAKKMFISPNYLGRIFREEMGCKFSDWLNHYRIDCAMELIKTTEMRTMDIAEAVGFGNYKYFSVCFTKYAGCSLRDFRTQNRRELPE